jgi:hypothetical protein
MIEKVAPSAMWRLSLCWAGRLVVKKSPLCRKYGRSEDNVR